MLNYIRNVPHEMGTTIADYEVGRTTGVLFLRYVYNDGLLVIVNWQPALSQASSQLHIRAIERVGKAI